MMVTPGKEYLTASSDSISASVELYYNGIEFEPDKAGQVDTVYVGENAAFGFKVFNRGNLNPVHCVDLVGLFLSCPNSCYDSLCFRPPSPGDSASSYMRMMIDSLTLNAQDTLNLFMRSKYLFGLDTIVVTSKRNIPVLVLQGLILKYAESSFSIDTIISPSTIPSISMQFEANEDLDPSRYTINFHPYYYSSGDEDGDDYGSLEGLFSDYYYSGRVLTVKIFIINIPDMMKNGWFEEGFRPLNGWLYVSDRVGRYNYWKELYNFDSVYFAFKGQLSYAPNSIKPKTVFPNRTVSFDFDIDLAGKVGIVLDSALLKNDSAFQLVDEDTILYSGIFPDSQILVPGVNHIRTGDIHIPEGLINDKASPRLIIKGKELYADRMDTILFGNERVSVSGFAPD